MARLGIRLSLGVRFLLGDVVLLRLAGFNGQGELLEVRDHIVEHDGILIPQMHTHTEL